MSTFNRDEILREGAQLAPASEIALTLSGENAEVVRALAAWMRWKPEEFAQALVAVALEGWDADEEELDAAARSVWHRYCATGRAPDGWRKKLGKAVLP